jgi:hypothetical protein
MKLYEIDEQIAACVDEETGEVIDLERLIALNMERERKLEGVALWVKDLTAEAKAIREEEKSLAERRRSAEKKVESLKAWLLENVGSGLNTARCSVSVRTNAESPRFADEAAFINWAQTKHDELLRYKCPEIDRTAVKQYLQSGGVIEGVTLERSQSIIIK